MEILETERLILKNGDIKDLQKYHDNFWSQVDTAKWVLWKPSTDLETSKTRFEKWSNENSENSYLWFMYIKSSNEPIGVISINKLSETKWGDAGMTIGNKFIRQGFGKEALTCVMDFAKQHGAKEVEYSLLDGNVASQKLAESLGFTYVDTKKRYVKKYDKEMDEVFYTKEI